MSRPRRTALGALLVVVTTFVPLCVGAVDAGAWSEGPCPTASGVTVVIDFQSLGGDVWIRCAPGAPTSGLRALEAAGVQWTPTVRFADFVCRIDGRPADDPCQNTPPASRYWSYWIAPRGGTWCYSNQGGRRSPIPGTVEGWSFSRTDDGEPSPPPRIAPPARVQGSPTSLEGGSCATTVTTTPVPTPTPSPPPGGGVASIPADGRPIAVPGSAMGGAGRPADSVAGSTTVAPAGPAVGSTVDDLAGAASDAPGSAPEASTEPSTTDGVDGDATRTTVVGTDGDEIALNTAPRTRRPDAGSPAGTLLAILLVGALGATAVVLRRRRAASP